MLGTDFVTAVRLASSYTEALTDRHLWDGWRVLTTAQEAVTIKLRGSAKIYSRVMVGPLIQSG